MLSGFFLYLTIIALPLPNRNIHASNLTQPRVTPSVFCHNFDLTKRLTNPPPGAITVLPVSFVDPQRLPFLAVVEGLSQHLESSPPSTIHRLIIPSILSPGLYPLHANHPLHVLRFLHSLRAILSRYSTRLTAMITLPLTLFPRSTGLVRWMEILSDGVLELTPFPYTIEAGPSITTSGTAKAQEEKPQGLVKVHRLPVFHDKGGGGIIGDIGNDLAFTISRRKFAIKPFNLPPVEGDNEAQKGETETKTTKVDVDF